MKRATFFLLSTLAAPVAVASCSSSDSSSAAPTCGGSTGIPCIDGALPDSDIFQYDAPAQYADVVLPDVYVPPTDDAGADANADAEVDAAADALAEASVDGAGEASADAQPE